MRRHVLGHVAVIDPQPAQSRLAAEDNRPHRLRRASTIILVAHGQVQFHAGPRTASLIAKILAEMLWKLPGVAVDVDDHGMLILNECRRHSTEMPRATRCR